MRRLRQKTSSALYVRRLPRNLPNSELDLKNLHIQNHSNDFKIEKDFKNKLRTLSNKKIIFKKYEL